MKYKVTLNGKTYEVEVERGEAIIVSKYPTPSLIEQSPAAQPESPVPQTAVKAPQTSSNAVLAPIPGTVIKIFGVQGKAVKRGEPILVIEAMKMENEILATEDGTLVAIYVSKGAKVETGDALFLVS